MSNDMPREVWDEIIHPFWFENFNGYIVEVWEWIDNLPRIKRDAITNPW